MMNYNEVLERAEALGNDAVLIDAGDVLHVYLNDFEGFDDEWNECMREYDNPEAVASFEEMLKREANEVTGDFYRNYQFNGFEVVLGYSSYEI